MIFINIPNKYNKSDETQTIDVDIKIKTIYELKTIMSKTLGISIDALFFYNNLNDKMLYQNCDSISDISTIYYKQIEKACNVCTMKAVITGDCSCCLCRFCNQHRLPESHNCAKIALLKATSYNDNYTRVMNGKCVSVQI